MEFWLCHGTPDDDSTYLLEELVDDGRFVPARRDVLGTRLESAAGARVVLCGHSHRQAVIHGPGECLILNPGSVGCPVFADIPVAPNLEYRSPHARYAILTKRGERWQVELLAMEYDWASASARALANGRPEWAQALSLGHVQVKWPCVRMLEEAAVFASGAANTSILGQCVQHRAVRHGAMFMSVTAYAVANGNTSR